MNFTVIHVFFFILSLHKCYGVIYHLNSSEYERMPPVYQLDDYSSCLQKPSDVYCTLNFRLVSDEHSELLHMIEEYSEHTKTHFDHTQPKYGICVTQNCRQYIQDNTTISETTLEACLNQSLWENYKLKTRLQHYYCYSLADHEVQIDYYDIFTGIVVFTIIMLNVVGSLYDIYGTSDKKQDKNILLYFSIKRNWHKLTSTKRSNDPRVENIKGLDGMKCFLEIGVIMTHCVFPFFLMSENIHDLEMAYQNSGQLLMLSSPIMMQTYFVISAFLMTYKMELDSEKQPTTWKAVPDMILKRYLRLTPAYALMILVLSTWFKFLQPGPLRERIRFSETLDCRNYWWINLLYFNNYVYKSQCSVPSWYLGADMQLFCCGVILYMLLKNHKSRQTILMALIIAGSIIVGVHTYVRDLDTGLFFAPNYASTMFVDHPAFNGNYKTAHGNLSSYLIGMSMAYFIYEWQKKSDNRKYMKFRIIYWALLPLMFGVIYSGAFFYKDGPREPAYLRALYVSISRLTIGTIFSLILAGTVMKLEIVYRNVVEWTAWTIPSRLTYGVYLIHFPCFIVYLNTKTSLLKFNAYNHFEIFTYNIIGCFVLAIPVFILVEAPFMELSKRITLLPKKEALVEKRNQRKAQ